MVLPSALGEYVATIPVRFMTREELEQLPVFGMHMSTDLRSGRNTHGVKPAKPVKKSRDQIALHVPEPENQA
jgi:hypothetical protein